MNLTLKHVMPDGTCRIMAILEAEYSRASEHGVPTVTAYYSEDEEDYDVFTEGTFYVMNKYGQTMQTFRLSPRPEFRDANRY